MHDCNWIKIYIFIVRVLFKNMKVYFVDSQFDAELKVYRANSKFDADAWIYLVDSEYDAENELLWYVYVCN